MSRRFAWCFLLVGLSAGVAHGNTSRSGRPTASGRSKAVPENRHAKFRPSEAQLRAFGAKIAALRSARRVSQREAGQHVQIDADNLGQLENGRRQPNMAILRNLATYYEVALDELSLLIAPEPGDTLQTRLRYHRLRNALSQEELALRLEVASATITHIERGRLLPSEDQFLKMVELFTPGQAEEALLGSTPRVEIRATPTHINRKSQAGVKRAKDPDAVAFGAKLRALRNSKGYSQTALVDRVNQITGGTSEKQLISAYERGLILPSMAVLSALDQVFEFPPGRLSEMLLPDPGNTFASRLRYYRLRSGVSQFDLARKVGAKGSGVIANYETGSRAASPPALARLVQELKVNEEQLLGTAPP